MLTLFLVFWITFFRNNLAILIKPSDQFVFPITLHLAYLRPIGSSSWVGCSGRKAPLLPLAGWPWQAADKCRRLSCPDCLRNCCPESVFEYWVFRTWEYLWLYTFYFINLNHLERLLRIYTIQRDIMESKSCPAHPFLHLRSQRPPCRTISVFGFFGTSQVNSVLVSIAVWVLSREFLPWSTDGSWFTQPSSPKSLWFYYF